MRVATRIFCALLAAAIVAVAVVAMVEVALALADRGPWLVDARPWFDDLSSEPWSSPTHRLILLITLAVGLVLLALAWAPRRPVVLPATGDRAPEGVQITLRRRDVERRLAAAAREVPYVVEASARADKRVSVVAGSTRSTDASVQREVQDAVGRAAEQLGLDRSTTKVRVRTSSGRAA